MNSSLVINNVLLNGKAVNILVSGNRFSRISSEPLSAPGAEVINGSGFAILPPFYNCHCHSAMNLLRGFADDMKLQPWLHDAIWPMEAKLSAHDIYAGSRLSILEMIKSGTVFFADMYWDVEQTARAAEELGVRAAIGISFMDNQTPEVKARNFGYVANFKDSDLVRFIVAPHAIYTVGTDLLLRCQKAADDSGRFLTIHLCETLQEDADCRRANNGLSPVQYMQSLGMLSPKTVLAHVVHVDDNDMRILASSGAVCVHNPASNMKLSSGIFKLQALQKAGCRLALGTDGAASNNNVDMLEEMKLAALLAKVSDGPEAGRAQEVFSLATVCGAQAFGIDAGVIAEGRLADAVLVDLNNERLVPNYNLVSNLVYSADSSCIDTVICNGRVIMRSHHVPGEEQIIEEARAVCANLLCK